LALEPSSSNACFSVVCRKLAAPIGFNIETLTEVESLKNLFPDHIQCSSTAWAGTYSISTSCVNAKAKQQQYKRTASEADKVHG
jgi:hypothetical protein